MGKKKNKRNRLQLQSNDSRPEESERVQLLNKLKSLNLKSDQLVFGCNAVLRLLEKDQLCLVITEKSISSLLYRPISMLCAHHGVSLLSLEPHELSDFEFKIKRITAFGMKKTPVFEAEDLKNLIQSVEMKINTHASALSKKIKI